jgi:hypothetical protein
VREVEGPQAAIRLFDGLLDVVESLEWVDPRVHVDGQWNLGGSLLDAGEADRAVGVLEVAVDNALMFYGHTHGHTLDIRMTYVRALDGDGRLDDALAQAQKIAEDAEGALGPDHPTTVEARAVVEQLTALVRAGGRVEVATLVRKAGGGPVGGRQELGQALTECFVTRGVRVEGLL